MTKTIEECEREFTETVRAFIDTAIIIRWKARRQWPATWSRAKQPVKQRRKRFVPQEAVGTGDTQDPDLDVKRRA